MKAKIGVAQRVHFLDQYSPGLWGTSACGKWAGQVFVLHDGTPVTCGDCRRLDPSKIEVKIVPLEPTVPESKET